MAEQISLTSKTRLKTNAVHHNATCLLTDKKTTRLFIAHSKGIHIYDTNSQQFEDLKIPNLATAQISCLTKSDDMVFFCAGVKIMGCGANGKVLFECDTFLAVDRIDAIYVLGYQLWLVAGNMISQFLIGGSQLNNKQSRNTPPPAQQIQDVNSQIYDVKINHSLLIKIDIDKPFLLLLKQNNQIQLYDKKQNNKIVLATDSPPTYAYLYPNIPNSNKVLVGMMNGELIYIEVDKKGLKTLWSIKQTSRGRINCIVQVKNGFILFRDQCLEMWNDNKELLGIQNTTDRIFSSIYIPQQETLFYATSQGSIVEMFNYEKMMKMSKERNELADKQKLIKQIEELKKIKAQLKAKVDKIAPNNFAAAPKQIKNDLQLSLDYGKLCYVLQIRSERTLVKVMIRGEVILCEGEGGLQFQGRQNNDMNVYLIKQEETNHIFVRFYYSEQYHQNEKLLLTIFNDFEGKLIASNTWVDLKHLYLHHKVQSKLNDKSALKTNSLTITGQFKYFLMNNWLGSIFNEFGSPSLDNEELNFCYQSLLTKNKVYISYKDNRCQFYSESPNPLAVIKKAIFQKCHQRNLSLNYDSKTNVQGIKNLLTKLSPRIRQLSTVKKQYELLPGLKELQNDSMSNDLKQILSRSEQIKAKYLQGVREYEQMGKWMVQMVASLSELRGKELKWSREELKTMLSDVSVENALKLIE